MGEASKLAPFQYFEIVFAYIFDITIFGVVPNFFSILGSGCVIISGLIIALKSD